MSISLSRLARKPWLFGHYFIDPHGGFDWQIFDDYAE